MQTLPVFCVLQKRGAAVKLDKNYAALMLIEILYERKLINWETLQAVREKLRESADIPKAA